MSWSDALGNINFVGVILGVLASMIIGALWYAPKVFGTQWVKLVGFKKKDMEDKSGMAAMMTTSLVFYTLLTITLAAVMQLAAVDGTAEGLLMGAILGFMFGYGPMSVTYIFARRRFELSMIDGGYIVVTTAVIGAILGYIG